MPGASPFPLSLPVNNILTSSTNSNSNATSIASSPASSSFKIEQLRHRIHQTHLSYLNTEDSPQKLELKDKLDVQIFELLSIVPHSHKFSCIDVANCFNRSIIEKSETYSPIDVASSFEKLEKYASNLLRHPWRKEYLSIHTYSGYYRHFIKNNLVESSQVLFAMGYREKNGSPGQVTLEGPIDPDKLTKVSLDCMIAMAEAQMLAFISESLKNKGHENVSYDEIFSIRVRFVTGLEHAIKLICDPSIGKSLNLKSPVSNSLSRPGHIDYNNTGLSSKSTSLPLPTYEPMADHRRNLWHEQASPVNDYVRSTNGQQQQQQQQQQTLNNRSNYGDSSMSPGANYIPPPAMFANEVTTNNHPRKYMNSSNGSSYSNNGSNVGNGSTSKNRMVNTTPRIGADTAGADVVDSIMSSLVNRPLNVKPPTTSNHPRIIPRSESDSSELRTGFRSDHAAFNGTNGQHSPSPPFNYQVNNHSTYQGLSNQTQTQLQQPQRIQYSAGTMTMSQPYGTSVHDQRTSSIGGLNHRKLHQRIEPSTMSRPQQASAANSSHEFMSSHASGGTTVELNRYTGYDSQVNCAKFPPSSNLENHPQPQQLQMVTNGGQVDPIISHGIIRTTTTRKPPPPPPPSQPPRHQVQPSQLPWSCPSCTYFNQGNTEVCDMCFRSKEKKGDSHNLVSGGKECSECTLVNNREVEFCKACGSNLIGSPTYI